MNKKLALLFFSASFLLSHTCFATSLATVDEINRYANIYEEYPDIDNDNWLNPNYTSFHKKNISGWLTPITDFLRITKKTYFQADDFKELLEKIIKQRENNGLIGRFVIKIKPKRKTNFIVLGDLHATFHSLARILDDLKQQRIINNNLEIIKDDYYFVFNGNAVDLSPYSLETLNIILHLMKLNPGKILYLRGKHEDKEHWRNFDLHTELNIKAPNISEKLIGRFFKTLPLALYLVSYEGEQTDIIRISSFDRNYNELNEDNFADFFVLDEDGEEVTIRSLATKTTSVKTVDTKAIIKTEDRLVKQTATEGLIQTDSDKGATAWMVLSAPNRTFRSLYKFFFDAYVVLKTNGNLNNWTISLYNQDVRDQSGIRKRKEYNLVSGDVVSGETLQIKTLKKQLISTQNKLKACAATKAIQKTPVISEKPDKKSEELKKKETEIAKKQAELKKREKELAKKQIEIQKRKLVKQKKTDTPEIVIGTTMGLTGNIQDESIDVRQGLQLRIGKENKRGGIDGKNLRLIVLDDGYTTKRARENALELINKYKTDIILFPVGSATTKSYLDLVNQKKVVVLFTTSGSPILRSPTPDYMIHLRPSYPDMYAALMSYVQKNFDSKKFAFIYQSDAAARGMQETIKNAGVKPEDHILVTHKRNVTEMKTQAEKIIQFKPDVIVFWTTSSASMVLMKEIGAENLINTKMVGADLGSTKFNEFLKNVGLTNNYIDAQALPNPKTSSLSILKEYREEMGNQPITGLSAEAYICASIMIHLIKQTGGTTDKAKIIKAAESIKNLDLGGLKLNFDKKSRKLSRFIWLNTGETEWKAIDVSTLEKNKSVSAPKKVEKPKKKPVKKEKAPEKKGDFVIGSSLDLSKSLKLEGEKMREGLDTYIRKVNREGGVRGRKVKLVVLDDGYDPQQARKNVETLINKHKTNIILSSLGSPTTAAYLDMIKEKKVLVAFPFTGSPVLRDPSYSHILHLTPPYDQIELALFKYGLEKLRAKRFSLFAQSDEMTEGVKKILEMAGVKKENYNFLGYERNTTDFSKQVKQMEEFKPNAIVLLSTSRAATEFLRQVGVEDLVGKKILGIQLGDIAFKEFIKQQGLQNIFFDIQTVPNPESDLPILKEYRKEMGNKKPDAYSAVAYVAAAIFFDILKKIEGPITNEAIIAATEKTKSYNLGGLNLNFEPSSRTILNYIWFDTGKKGDWEKVEVKPKKLK